MTTPQWVVESLKRKSLYYENAFQQNTGQGTRLAAHTELQFPPSKRIRREHAARKPDELASKQELRTTSEVDVMDFLSMARAQSTRRQYDSIKRAYEQFVAANSEGREEVFPLDTFMLIRYAAHLCVTVSRTGRPFAGSTIKNYIRILLTLNKAHPRSRPPTVEESELVRLAKQAVDRIKGKTLPARAKTLTAEQVKSASYLVPSSGRYRSTAALVVSVCALLRIREASMLKMSDIVITESRARICIRESKTCTTPQWVTVGCACRQHSSEQSDPWCPYHKLIEATDGSSNPDDILFSASYSELKTDVEELVELVSDDAEEGKCTSHSMRRTGVVLMKSSGMDSVLVAEHGRWLNTRMVDDVYSRQMTGIGRLQAGFAKRMLC